MLRITDEQAKRIGAAVITQSVADFEAASRYYARYKTSEQMDMFEQYEHGNLGKQGLNRVEHLTEARTTIIDVIQFFRSDWVRDIAGERFDVTAMVTTLIYRDWARQSRTDGFIIPRGNEYVPKADFTSLEKQLYITNTMPVSGHQYRRNDYEIEKWFGSLSPEVKDALSRERNFDPDAIWHVLGIKWSEE